MAEPVPGRDSFSLPEQLRGAANILVLVPSFGHNTSAVCTDLCAGDDPPSATVMSVTYRRSPAEWIETWERHTGTGPAHGMVIGVGDQRDGATSDDAEAWTVETVENASDLTGLGIELSDFLGRAHEAESVDQLRLCFDSVTALLQYADVKRTFRFLHVVTGRVKSANAVAHYHLDPAAHDEQTLATIKGLFDAVVDVDENGDWTVQMR